MSKSHPRPTITLQENAILLLPSFIHSENDKRLQNKKKGWKKVDEIHHYENYYRVWYKFLGRGTSIKRGPYFRKTDDMG